MVRGGAESRAGRRERQMKQRAEKSRQSSGLSGHSENVHLREANRNWGESSQAAKHQDGVKKLEREQRKAHRVG